MFYTGHIELESFELQGMYRTLNEIYNRRWWHPRLSDPYYRKIILYNTFASYSYWSYLILTKEGTYEKISRKLKDMLSVGELTGEMKKRVTISEFPADEKTFAEEFAVNTVENMKEIIYEKNSISTEIIYITDRFCDDDRDRIKRFAETMDDKMNEFKPEFSMIEDDPLIDFTVGIMEDPTVYIYGRSDRIEI